MKFLSSILAVLVLSIASLAQFPEGPNTGKATTPYSTNNFSATFNGAVTAKSAERNSPTAVDYVYFSQNENVSESVVVRFVDHDIAVDYTSSDYYANDDRTGGTVDSSSTSHGTWGNGSVYTYTFRTFTFEGVELTKRTRYIIVNSREVIFVYQVTRKGYEDRPEWLDFEYSLRIK
jgi:hypothetical protein